jgi:hypothetical protein
MLTLLSGWRASNITGVADGGLVASVPASLGGGNLNAFAQAAADNQAPLKLSAIGTLPALNFRMDDSDSPTALLNPLKNYIQNGFDNAAYIAGGGFCSVIVMKQPHRDYTTTGFCVNTGPPYILSLGGPGALNFAVSVGADDWLLGAYDFNLWPGASVGLGLPTYCDYDQNIVWVVQTRIIDATHTGFKIMRNGTLFEKEIVVNVGWNNGAFQSRIGGGNMFFGCDSLLSVQEYYAGLLLNSQQGIDDIMTVVGPLMAAAGISTPNNTANGYYGVDSIVTGTDQTNSRGGSGWRANGFSPVRRAWQMLQARDGAAYPHTRCAQRGQAWYQARPRNFNAMTVAGALNIGLFYEDPNPNSAGNSTPSVTQADFEAFMAPILADASHDKLIVFTAAKHAITNTGNQDALAVLRRDWFAAQTDPRLILIDMYALRPNPNNFDGTHPTDAEVQDQADIIFAVLNTLVEAVEPPTGPVLVTPAYVNGRLRITIDVTGVLGQTGVRMERNPDGSGWTVLSSNVVNYVDETFTGSADVIEYRATPYNGAGDGAGVGTATVGAEPVTLPPATDVRLNVDRGDGTLGTLAVPSAANVRTGIAVAQTVGTLAVPAAADVRLGTSVAQTVGSLAVPTPAQVLAGVAVGATVGTVTLPAAADVESGVTFGAGGNEFTGSLVATGGGGVTEDDIEAISDAVVEKLGLGAAGDDSVNFAYVWDAPDVMLASDRRYLYLQVAATVRGEAVTASAYPVEIAFQAAAGGALTWRPMEWISPTRARILVGADTPVVLVAGDYLRFVRATAAPEREAMQLPRYFSVR